jgi:hypothetical protein
MSSSKAKGLKLSAVKYKYYLKNTAVAGVAFTIVGV